MTHVSDESQQENQMPFYIDPEEQRTIGRVFNSFVPEYWNSIKGKRKFKDEVLYLASFDRITWLVDSCSKSELALRRSWGYHLIILDPNFDLEPLTDPMPVRTLNDPG